MNPETSVVIPVSNGERFIDGSISTVLDQTYAGWELVVVNDGSTDGTARILDGIQHERVRVIHQQNRGLAAARNVGLSVAAGNYAAFLDADDEWEPFFLERCVQRLRGIDTDDVAGVYTSFAYIDEQGSVLPQPGSPCVRPGDLAKTLMVGGLFPPHAAVLKLEVLKQLGGFDEELAGQGAEDWDLWLRLSDSHRLVGISEPLARYRVGHDSMSSNITRMHQSRMAVVAKHFGENTGRPDMWPLKKRKGYAYATRALAFSLVQAGRVAEGWATLMMASDFWDGVLEEIATYYEFACGNQPRGYRGTQEGLDLARSGPEFINRLKAMLSERRVNGGCTSKRAMATALLALASLADSINDLDSSRRYILRSFFTSPRLLFSRGALRRAVKLHLPYVFRLSKRTAIADQHRVPV